MDNVHPKSIFRSLSFFISNLFKPKPIKIIPSHREFEVMGESVEDCFSKLEKKAGLPKGDLYINKNIEPYVVASFPFGQRSNKYAIESKLGESWKKDPSKEGYIVGSLLEPVTKVSSGTSLNKLTVGEAFAISSLNSVKFFATLNVVKNCSGVFSGNVCKHCGYEHK